MDKGESLDHYFKNIKFLDFIIVFLLPGLNTIISVLAIFYILFKKIWDKIKYWEK
jgi:Na+/H+ antiporter NhaD/arsenite permease-like protein